MREGKSSLRSNKPRGLARPGWRRLRVTLPLDLPRLDPHHPLWCPRSSSRFSLGFRAGWCSASSSGGEAAAFAARALGDPSSGRGLACARTLMITWSPQAPTRGRSGRSRRSAAAGTLGGLAALVRHKDALARLRRWHSARTQRVEREALDARLRLLQRRSPHFLFNTLANVQALVETGSPRASAVLQSLVAIAHGGAAWTGRDHARQA